MKANKLSAASRTGLAAVIFLLNGFNTKAQNSSEMDTNTAVARLIRYEVKPKYLDVFRKAINDYVLYSLNIESNILSEGYYEQDKTSVLWIIERWENKIALDTISEGSRFKAINSLYKTALVQPAKTFYVKDLEPLSTQQWRIKANKGDMLIMVMLFVDSKPGTENNFKEVYHTAMPKFRSEPGVINYQLSQFEDDKTRFVTYEKFRSENAFQYHLNFPPIQPVIDYLNTSIKKQPFQTGLHKLTAFAPLSND